MAPERGGGWVVSVRSNELSAAPWKNTLRIDSREDLRAVGIRGRHGAGELQGVRRRPTRPTRRAAVLTARMLLRWALAGFLAFAGVGHFARPDEFLAQVPPYLPAPELLVAASGVVELLLAVALVALPRHRRIVGFVVLLFFLAVLPGNIAQYTEGRDAFGLNTDGERLTRVLLSPLLWLWATAAGDLWPRPRRRV
jgi:uncharacterized membrane protein